MIKAHARRAAHLTKHLALILGMAGTPLSIQAANPFLPSSEYIPDGDPHVVGDRVYLYGSHDLAGSDGFCDYILKVWSAPLNDLNNWKDHGVVLSTRDIDGRKDDISWSDNQFYAPDILEVDGKYYLYAQIVGAPCAVAVSDSPAGPFKVISNVKPFDGAPMDFGGWAQYFDPGLLRDDNGKIYIYWGGGRSHMARLDPENPTRVLAGIYQEDVVPREEPFNYQEGPSPRKINGTYYMVYARGEDLAYATSASPTGPFAYRGVIVSQKVDANSGNIHGGLANLNGQWFIFYHRQTNKTVFSRRACAERVTIEADGSIKQVEQTSLGFEESLDPYKTVPADIASMFDGGNYVTELDQETHPVVDNRNSSLIGYKYFDFGKVIPGRKTSFSVQLRDGAVSGKMEVWLGDPRDKGLLLGTVDIEKQRGGEAKWRRLTIPIRDLGGRHAVFLKFASVERNAVIADVRAFAFTRDSL